MVPLPLPISSCFKYEFALKNDSYIKLLQETSIIALFTPKLLKHNGVLLCFPLLLIITRSSFKSDAHFSPFLQYLQVMEAVYFLEGKRVCFFFM